MGGSPQWSLHRHASKGCDCFLENQLVSPGLGQQGQETQTTPRPSVPAAQCQKQFSKENIPQSPLRRVRGGRVPFLLDSGCSRCIRLLRYRITLLTRIPHCLSSQEGSTVCKTPRNTCLFRTRLSGAFLLCLK